MRPMMRLVLGLIVLAGIMAGVAYALPAHVTVQRSVVINAPESAVFPYVNNPHHFGDWSPWKLRDPDLQFAFSGPEEGKGATVAWTSEKRAIGAGSMEITDSEPNKSIDLVVSFNGLEGTSRYEIAPSGAGSKVTWNFGYDTGSSPLKRWKGLALDGLIGAEYQSGLNKLKEKVEAERRPTEPVMSPPLQPGVAGEPPSGALPQGANAGPGAAVPMGVQPAPQGAGGQQGAAPTAQAAPAEAEPEEAAPAPQPKKKRRRR